jgi:glycosyltransferase involved in cell wall biosynthesis
MKILFIHNAYQHSGGEDGVVKSEIALLRQHGHRVESYLRHNDELKQMSSANAAISALWSRRSVADFDRLCADFRPDVLHVHNTFPLISPAIYWAARRKNLPIVQTLHNFRLLCPQAIFLRDGKTCEDCLGKLPWRAITRKCYRHSALQSSVVVSMLATHRLLKTYRNKVTRYIALNAFCKQKFVEAGFPSRLFSIKPNFVAAQPVRMENRRSGGLYVGRLSEEKGIGTLMQADSRLDANALEIIGSGPLENEVSRTFGNRYLGTRSLDQVMEKMQTALFLVVPSICYESSPRTIIEAFSSGLPVIASRLGPLADIVQEGVTGLLFSPGEPLDLAAKMSWAKSHPEKMLQMGSAARLEYEAKYTPERNLGMLMSIYKDAIADITEKRHVG